MATLREKAGEIEVGLEFCWALPWEEGAGLRDVLKKQRLCQDCGWVEVWRAVTRLG